MGHNCSENYCNFKHFSYCSWLEYLIRYFWDTQEGDLGCQPALLHLGIHEFGTMSSKGEQTAFSMQGELRTDEEKISVGNVVLLTSRDSPALEDIRILCLVHN